MNEPWVCIPNCEHCSDSRCCPCPHHLDEGWADATQVFVTPSIGALDGRLNLRAATVLGETAKHLVAEPMAEPTTCGTCGIPVPLQTLDGPTSSFVSIEESWEGDPPRLSRRVTRHYCANLHEVATKVEQRLGRAG